MSYTLTALLLAAAPVSAQIPPAFRGDWFEANGELPSCAGSAGGGPLQVRPNEIEDPIFTYKVIAVRRLSPTSVHVRFTMRSEDQNITQNGSARLILSDNGTRLEGIGENELAREYITDNFRRCKK